MSPTLFNKIIDEIGISGSKIIPYFNNEPFLDPYFIERLKYIQKKCSNSMIEISTNMSLLNKSMQDKLQGIVIDDLRLSTFGFTSKTHKKIMPGISWNKVFDNLKSLSLNKTLRSNIRSLSLVMINYPDIDKNDIKLAKQFCKDNDIKFKLWGFLDRSGNVDLYSNNINNKKIIGCEYNRPIERMHITHTGKVVICCMDWKWNYVLGDLNNETIQNIWNSNKYNNIRKSIYDGFGAPKICLKCKLSISGK